MEPYERDKENRTGKRIGKGRGFLPSAIRFGVDFSVFEKALLSPFFFFTEAF